MSVNPSKTARVPFIRIKNLRDLVPLSFNVDVISFATGLKFLCFILDRNSLGTLPWKGPVHSQTVLVDLSKDMREILVFRTQTNPLDISDDYQTDDHATYV